MTTLKDIGEFNFIKRFSGQFLQQLPKGVIGIGDDCAVIPFNATESLLLSTDTLVDTVHFISSKMEAVDLGYKSLTVNLSDIAAMGGKPDYVLLALSVPPNTDIKWLDDFFAGFKECCDKYQVHLIGGDMTKTPDKLVITVTVIGKAITNNIKYRSNARINDIICVTGIIGDSVGGLHCYLNNLQPTEATDTLKKAHFRPRPHIQEGLWLSSTESVHCMIDISDGIESDVKRIMESSQCGAEIELTSLPSSISYQKTAQQQKWNVYEMAITGGEDYCLLVTVDPEAYDDVRSKFYNKFSTPLTAIGKIVPQDRGLSFFLNGKKRDLSEIGYDHFLNES